MTRPNISYLRFLRRFSIIEGISTLILFFIAMPLKYYFDLPLAVTVVGSVHGLLFLGVVATFLIGMEKIPLSIPLAVAGVFGAVIPFGPFVVDIWLKRIETNCAEAGS